MTGRRRGQDGRSLWSDSCREQRLSQVTQGTGDWTMPGLWTFKSFHPRVHCSPLCGPISLNGESGGSLRMTIGVIPQQWETRPLRSYKRCMGQLALGSRVVAMSGRDQGWDHPLSWGSRVRGATLPILAARDRTAVRKPQRQIEQPGSPTSSGCGWVMRVPRDMKTRHTIFQLAHQLVKAPPS